MRVTHALTALPFAGVLIGIFFANRTEPSHMAKLQPPGWKLDAVKVYRLFSKTGSEPHPESRSGFWK